MKIFNLKRVFQRGLANWLWFIPLFGLAVFLQVGQVLGESVLAVTGTWQQAGQSLTESSVQPPAAPQVFTVRGSDDNQFLLTIDRGDWDTWQMIDWHFQSQDEWPAGTRICFFTKDRDFLWRQICHPWPRQAGREAHYQLPLQGATAARQWQPTPHSRSWHELTAGHLIEAGFAIRLPPSSDDFIGQVKLRSLQLRQPVKPPVAPPRVNNLQLQPTQPQVGKMVQLRIWLEAAYDNPFDRADIAIDGEVIRPDGQREQVAGFYYEGFMTEPGQPHQPLVPAGQPEFRWRYTPRVKGQHQVQITICGQGGSIQLPVLDFKAAPADPDYHGFVRVDPDHQLHLSYDSGKIFDGIGLNIRTPYDLRYLAMKPASTWRDQGLEVYTRMIPRLAEAGGNVIEVWMSSWWLALEWINDAPGFHGVGYFNPYRAWKLDQLLQLAEEHGVYLILVLNNHGKFSTFCDQEWNRNPYNLENGGFLSSPDLYFSEEKAHEAFKRTADYIVARWGYSPNILIWKLFSEINLTGTSNRVYRRPPMREWHREMSEYLKQIDPYRHMVTTHWSSNYRVINDAIASLPELDLLSTDAYSGSASQVLNFFVGTTNYGEKMEKPTIITEYGGPPRGESIGTLSRQLRIGLWKGYFLEAAILPMLWWFGLVDEHNLYDEFAAIAAFRRGEDRRGMKRDSQTWPEAGVTIRTLTGQNRWLAWGFDREYYLAREENLLPRKIEGRSLTIEGLSPGSYQLEIWEEKNHRPSSIKRGLEIEEGKGLDIEVPPFQRDFALKIIPASPPVE